MSIVNLTIFVAFQLPRGTKEENAAEVKKSSYTEEDLRTAYQKGRRVGQVSNLFSYICKKKHGTR